MLDHAGQRRVIGHAAPQKVGDSNLYRYVANRPTVATDPSGMELIVNGDASLRVLRRHVKKNWGIDLKAEIIGGPGLGKGLVRWTPFFGQKISIP